MHWPDQNTSHELPPYLDKLNPAQKEAAMQTDGPVMIIAGAGSGKTRVLTFRMAFLLHKGAEPFSILALTFTNKAAKEMRNFHQQSGKRDAKSYRTSGRTPSQKSLDGYVSLRFCQNS